MPASATTAEGARVPTQHDLDTLSRQLNRPVRDVVEIPARCVCGNPLVAATAPRLGNGIPFPTTFYLTHPVLTAAASRLEASGLMTEMTDRLAVDAELAAGYQRAHESYIAARTAIGERAGTGPVPEINGISAGGMPTRVKCLHVLVGHALAAGPGVNPLGDEALAALAQWWTADACQCEGAWDDQAPVPIKDLSRHVKHLNALAAEETQAQAVQPDVAPAAAAKQDGAEAAAADAAADVARTDRAG
ncbi:DUF501 domain-containing protein [Arthrobacter livingstonensis]|uniref:DUF501 domain-containing protein n=1 Tax=Arthrobacter livingstonensis TaxID=670078 RepID=A0A2V5LD08_9MICC|nr:DUF501 domain-containing protein [Arthrobacter livingstonensis]PYI68444.1 DUF501 domain-containing protein [Arthrobacter livingstonensis]